MVEQKHLLNIFSLLAFAPPELTMNEYSMNTVALPTIVLQYRNQILGLVIPAS